MTDEAPEIFAAWADIPSAVLLALSIWLGGLSPVRPLWGRSWQHTAAFMLVMLAQAAFTIARFVVEGVFRDAGPREFMASSVVYITRWVFLFTNLSDRRTIYGRLYQVGQALRYVKILRLGVSKYPEHYGQKEIVLRRGCRDAGKGTTYWRGVIEKEPVWTDGGVWALRLREAGLHAEQLDLLGTTEYRQLAGFQKDDAYKRFYDVVMTASNADIMVDYTEFFEQWEGVGVTRFAERVGANSNSELGRLARRVASDATFYANFPDSEWRTARQVACINACLEKAFDRIIIGTGQYGEQAV